MNRNVKKDFFQIQGLEHKSYEGITIGDFFNDYECPLFSLDVAMEIMKDLNISWENGVTEEAIIYDKYADEFLYTHALLNEEYIKFKPKTINNKKLYGIGYFSWCWKTEQDMQEELQLQRKSIDFERVEKKKPLLRLVVDNTTSTKEVISLKNKFKF